MSQTQDSCVFRVVEAEDMCLTLLPMTSQTKPRPLWPSVGFLAAHAATLVVALAPRQPTILNSVPVWVLGRGESHRAARHTLKDMCEE